ncbi:MAG: glycerol kinase GlpK [Planctomycetota bacterium]|nr:glycerol kinase GlpK [Planctomycetota bacterium]
MNADPRQILAVDQSTSATKAVVFDVRGRLIDRFSIEHRPIYPRPGWIEHDAEELWRNTQSVIRSAAEKYSSFICLSISNQRETFVIFDRATGRPLHNAVVWQCRRGDHVCAQLIGDGHANLVSAKTGLKIDSYFSAPKLTALLRECPDLRPRLESGEALFGTIDTYLLYRLTNGKTFATDSTNACRTLLFNVSTLKWDQELCDLFDVPINALPEVRDSSSRFGLCDCPALPANLPIVGIMGDSQAALFAQRCFNPGQAKITIGTGSSILLNTGTHLPSTGIRTIGWTHNGSATYCLEGIISYAGATITWLRDQLGLIHSADETEAAACAVPDNGGVYLVPAFTGLSAPYWSPTARAAIVGLSASSTRNHVLRAALESIAYQIKDALDAMTADSQIPLTLIRADGGATHNRFLMQFIADIVGANIILSSTADFSPLGAALAGLLGMGVYASIHQLTTLPIDELAFTPRMAHPLATALHAQWNIAVGQVLAGHP